MSPVVVPSLGAERPIVSIWLVRPGDRVYAGDRVVELLVSGATFDVQAPVTGRLVDQLALPDDLVHPGQILGYVEEEQ